MYLGFTLMNTHLDPSPNLLAPRLEQSGFESLWYGEHSHIPVSRLTPYPQGGELPEPYKLMRDPFVSLSYAAASTKKLRLGTAIALIMERELFSLACTLATLDELSGGRLMIGTGVGWNEEAFRNATSLPWKRRYQSLQETAGALKALWTQEQASYHGELIDFDPVWLEPKPAQPRGPDIILGVMGPKGIGEAAKWADGWMPVDAALPDVGQAVKGFHQLVRDAGRNPEDIKITLVMKDHPSEDRLRELHDLGIYRAIVSAGIDNWNNPSAVDDTIRRYEKIIPKLSCATEQ